MNVSPPKGFFESLKLRMSCTEEQDILNPVASEKKLVKEDEPNHGFDDENFSVNQLSEAEDP